MSSPALSNLSNVPKGVAQTARRSLLILYVLIFSL